MVRLENTTMAGMEFEAALEAEIALTKRGQWVEVKREGRGRAWGLGG